VRQKIGVTLPYQLTADAVRLQRHHPHPRAPDQVRRHDALQHRLQLLLQQRPACGVGDLAVQVGRRPLNRATERVTRADGTDAGLHEARVGECRGTDRPRLGDPKLRIARDELPHAAQPFDQNFRFHRHRFLGRSGLVGDENFVRRHIVFS
jgi:hypothetical protein